ncbi:cyclohexanone monooxygenase [Rhizodiscina lignyota]|uniref:Cyclohexanone monooxygenase n=1 Tax=Rhizodiscina lignyota TaxID=1504668 RepID=A0A9P4I8X5_9PEZI|nr:cyclohexanone monooxygenase [Rhizodiscina lignyota]
MAALQTEVVQNRLNGHIQHQSSNDGLDFDAIVIGAGISGLYQLHRLRQLGMKVKVFEAGSDVGGTWYWNRYPGARFDSESYSYCYSFDKDLLDHWTWTEHFAGQPETLRYVQHVADRFDLRRDVQFHSKVTAAHYDNNARCWNVFLESEVSFSARFLVTAIGPLSTPTLPRYEGLSSFKGQSFHTARWPKDGPRSFEGKRVAVIGTGATGIQTIQEVAKTAQHLHVFQRRPNWSVPLHNRPITSDEMAQIKTTYPDIFEKCQNTFSCFLHTPDLRNTFDVSPEEREAFYEQRYASPGFGLWLGSFADTLKDEKANAEISRFVAKKIRQRVKDQTVAEKLIPKDHGFGTRRVPLETKYFEVYNQPNVELVDLQETPIVRITEKGIRTSEKELEFDLIIYATGFDAITGSFDRIDIRGQGGLQLKQHWSDGPQTFLGITVNHFPNMAMIVGPHVLLGNLPRSIEYGVGWITDLLRYMKEHELTKFAPTDDAVEEWTQYVIDIGKGTLSSKVDSWMTGVNSNVDGKQKRYIARYSGSAAAFRERCDKVTAGEYKELELL